MLGGPAATATSLGLFGYRRRVREVIYVSSDRVARISINRPERRNALSPAVIEGLREGIAKAKSDPEARVVVLAGEGDAAFCAGADLADMGAIAADLVSAHEGRGELAHLFEDLWHLGKPTIARVQGYALAGGFGLALSCDFVVASEDARFGTPEIDVGLWPFMITVPLTRSMPAKKALELMATGRRVGAPEGERIGFVTRVVPTNRLDTAVDELARTLTEKPPGAMKLGRDSFYSVLGVPSGPALDHLQSMLTLTAMTDEAREGLSAFAEKRAPSWRS